MTNRFVCLLWFAAFLIQSNAAAQSLTLGTDSLTFGTESGSGTLVISAAGEWTASTSDTWLHISPDTASGTGSALFRFAYDANTGATRTGSISFNSGEAKLTVTQSGSTYVQTNDLNRLTTSFRLSGIAIDGQGNLYFADSGELKEWIAATGQVSVIVRFGVQGSWGVALDGQGNLYFSAQDEADQLAGLLVADTVQKWTKSTGRVSTVVPSRSGVYIGSMTADPQGNVFVFAAENAGSSLEEWPANTGQVITLESGLTSVTLTMTTDAGGNLYVADAGNDVIQKWIPSTGQVTTLVSTYSPTGIGLDGMGNIYFLNGSGFFPTIQEWSPVTGQVTNIGYPSMANGLAVSNQGDVFYTNNDHQAIEGLGGGTIVVSPFNGASAVTADAAGNVYFSRGEYVNKLATDTGEITTLISSGLLNLSSLALDTAGNVYIADAGNGTVKEWIAQTGQLITLVSTGLFNAFNIAVDSGGNVYIADYADGVVKQWNAQSGQLTTLIASGLSMPTGVAVDAAGNVYIGDLSYPTGTSRAAIKKWAAATGQITTLVPFCFCGGDIAVDGAGNVYFGGAREWVAATGQVVALVSTAGQPYQFTSGLGLDANGNLYFAGFSPMGLPEYTLNRLTRGFVSLSDITEPLAPGSDQLPPVLPLGTPLEPSSDQPWLIVGDQVNGALSFSFNSATGPRAGHISVLGREVTIAQGQVVGPQVVSYSVLWGSQTYDLTGSTRDRMPWQITGIRVVFSEPVFLSALDPVFALEGITPYAVSGTGTNALTWTINPVSAGSFALDLAKTSHRVITDSAGNALTGNASQNLTVLFGDFNGDGIVDVLDMTGVNLARFGPYNIFADINGDGVVNAADVQIVRTQIGSFWP